MKYRSGLRADYFEISALNMIVESGAYLRSDGRVTNATAVDQEGQGAAHASQGGGEGGGPGIYGSLLNPEADGSAAIGGSRGGGSVSITVGRKFTLDGEISVNADNQMNYGLGAGSGGSILVRTGLHSILYVHILSEDILPTL